jgi:cold shock CspA family protein
MRGVIKRFVGERGFGFITPDGSSSDVFFHIKDCVGLPFGIKPAERDIVEFDVVADPLNGKLKAKNVRLV